MSENVDKRTIVGLVLIGLVLFGWIYMQMFTQKRPLEPTKQAEQKQEAVKTPIATKNQSAPPQAPLGPTFSPMMSGQESFTKVETDLFTAYISNKGGNLARFELKKYRTWYGDKSQLLSQWSREMSFSFISKDGFKVESRKLTFDIQPASPVITVKGSDSLVLVAKMVMGPGAEIRRTMVFYGDKYSFRSDLAFQGMDPYINPTTRWYDISWTGGLQYQEQNSVDESNTAVVMASLNGSIEEHDVATFNEPVSFQISGIIDFVATRIKYFTVAIKQNNPPSDATVFLNGTRIGAPNDGAIERYGMTLRHPYRGGAQTSSFTVYLGPQEYDELKKLGLGSTINFGNFFGVKFLVAPLGEYVLLPLFRFLHMFISNWGVVILVFSVLMKVALYPFSISQMGNLQKIKVLEPVLAPIREKYKDDPMTQRQEVAKIYQQYGVSMTGGCLPLLLQMPILAAMFAVFNSAIDLRQAGFLPFWITDLSIPDVIVNFGFKIPLFGVSAISGLAILLALTTFFQQKMSITDPSQKATIYMMPVMFVFIFSSLPAGLNLYYLVFNVLSIAQQIYQTNYSKSKLTLEQLKRQPVKEGWLQKKMREAQEIAESQGRSVPGQKQINGRASGTRESGQKGSKPNQGSRKK